MKDIVENIDAVLKLIENEKDKNGTLILAELVLKDAQVEVDMLRRYLASKPTFPMLNGPSINWATAGKIYKIYSALYGTQQSLEKLGSRGGFGWNEVDLMCRRYDDQFGTRALVDLIAK